MKSLSLVAGLSVVLQLVAGQILANDLVNRQACSWEGHCLGATCETENDCDGDLICRAGRCANLGAVGGGGGGRTTTRRRPTPTPTPTRGVRCDWEGHCLGDECDTENDCDGDLICRAGRCANPSASIPSTTPRRPTSTRRPTTTPRPTPTPTPTGTCEWEGHCLGATCAVDEDCDGDLACRSRRCARPGGAGSGPSTIVTLTTVTLPEPPEVTGGCGLDLCIGASCATDADCGDNLLICRNGRCGL